MRNSYRAQRGQSRRGRFEVGYFTRGAEKSVVQNLSMTEFVEQCERSGHIADIRILAHNWPVEP